MATQIQIANQESFLASVREAQAKVSDLTVPFQAIQRDWMRTNQLLFQQSGPGQWPDLKRQYKKQKQKRWGFVYPMLMASGQLERSVTQAGDPNALFEIVNGTNLVLGSRAVSKEGANYPAFLSGGTRRMPARPWAQVPQISVQRWIQIIHDYVVQVTDEAGKSAPA